ncbi:hypothetical protein SynMITS9220_00751 [Synechococcus sp. MIT S9220]|nr:hypothetical protein SynMITS9220_00751 [Synechococcus sp. MIT S9220]
MQLLQFGMSALEAFLHQFLRRLLKVEFCICGINCKCICFVDSA